MPSRQRILIIHLGGSPGDLIFVSPVVASLKDQWPESEILLIAPGPHCQLASCVPGIARAIDWDRGKMGTMLRTLRGGYDISIDFSGNNNGSLFLTTLAHAPVRAGYREFTDRSFLRRLVYNATSDAKQGDLHAIDCHLAVLDTFDCKARVRKLSLQPPSGSYRLPGKFSGQSFILVHPGTEHPRNMWSLQGWCEVIDHLAESGKRIVLTSGSDELERAHTRKILATCQSKGHLDLAGKLDWPELVSVVSQCQAAIGVDNTAMQIATALEKPQLVLFGGSHPLNRGPRHGQALVLYGSHPDPLTKFDGLEGSEEMGSISATNVIRALHRLC